MMDEHATLTIDRKEVLRKFRRPPFEGWSKDFFFILFACFAIEFLTVYFLSRRPVEEYNPDRIARVQERFAQFVLEKAVQQTKKMEIGIGVSAPGKGSATGEASEAESGTTQGEGKKAQGRLARGGSGGYGGLGSGTRRQALEAISKEVSGKGILALITSSGTGASGENPVSGVLNGTGGVLSAGSADLDRILSSVDGLKTSGVPGGGVGSGISGGSGSGLGEARDIRSQKLATIDDLVSGGGASSRGLSRQGELRIEAPSEFTGQAHKNVYRSGQALREVLLRHVPAIQYCYERELRRNPELRGKVVVRITVAPDGSVKNAVIVSSTLENERVERCILSRILLWKDFPPIDPSEGDVTFRQVYTFGS